MLINMSICPETSKGTHPKPAVCFNTFGCRSNQAETAVLENRLSASGYRLVDDPRYADLSVINTCTVTEKTDAETRKTVRRIVRTNPGIRIALIGCQAQTQAEYLASLPNVKWIIGNARKMDLDKILSDNLSNGKVRLILDPMTDQRFSLPAPAISRKHTRANLKIQDGCNGYCSYCEIPYARGPARSRYFNDIVREAECLANAGHKEIVLTGINIGNYRDGHKTLTDVIYRLAPMADIHRIRISSIEPAAVVNELAQIMVKGFKLCRHLHIPIQHTCDPILKLMNRRYTYDDLRRWLSGLAEKVPDICIGADIIVGFPGETEELFQQMLNRLQKLPIHHYHVFSYSPRKLAKSKDLPGHIPRSVVVQRSRVLQQYGFERRRAFYARYLGKDQPVLWEQNKNGYFLGLTDNFIHVRCRSSADLANRILPCRFARLDKQEIIGELISEEPNAVEKPNKHLQKGDGCE